MFWKHLWSTLCGDKGSIGEKLGSAADELFHEGKKERRHLLFSGRVQEVGFRYTAYYIACDLGLTGWVCNLSDGRVEMEIQGTEEKIDIMLHKLMNSGRIEVEDMETEIIKIRKEDKFRVRG